MSVTVRIPSPLYRLTGDLSVVEAQGDTVSAVLQDLDMKFPGLKDQLCDAEGTLLFALRQRGPATGLASLCLGGGGAVALAVELE